MRVILIALFAFILSGCAVTPYKELKLDTTSNFNKPNEGMAGIYVYQWKTGFVGAGLDVDFEIKGMPEISLNTGEYAYIELKPGVYEYKFSGGLVNQFVPIHLEANQNYFFRAFLLNFSDHIVMVRSQNEIEEAKKNILSGRYELYSVD